MRALITGMSGFVGSHLAEHLLENTDWEIVAPVTFRHKGDSLRVHDGNFDKGRVTIYYHDLNGPISSRLAAAIGPVDIIFNVASDSHVDRSIVYPVDCITNNVNVVLNTLEFARIAKPKLFMQISTDEVYGPAAINEDHPEWDSIQPSNPYSASKACQEAIAFSYWRTYGVPVVITNTMNIFGERQDPEKFIPMAIKKILSHEPVPVHCAPNGTPGSRYYLHARNQADALLFLAKYYLNPPAVVDPSKWLPLFPAADVPARYNIVGEREVDNLEMARLLSGLVGEALQFDRVNFHSSRPGHDLRYALNGNKLRAMGWRPPVPFFESLKKTVEWTLAHREWLYE